MSPLRWAITIVAFPLGGLAAIQVASTSGGFLPSAVAGLIAGTVIGLAQWLALRPAVSPLWILATAGGFALGAGLGAVATASATSGPSLLAFGAIAGAFVGAAQGLLLRGGLRRAAIWMLVVGASWAIAWFVTAAVIVDEQRGYVIFGLSGAAVATLATGIALRLLLGARGRARRVNEVTA